MTQKSSKMSSRSGNVIPAMDLIDALAFRISFRGDAEIEELIKGSSLKELAEAWRVLNKQ